MSPLTNSTCIVQSAVLDLEVMESQKGELPIIDAKVSHSQTAFASIAVDSPGGCTKQSMNGKFRILETPLFPRLLIQVSKL